MTDSDKWSCVLYACRGRKAHLAFLA